MEKLIIILSFFCWNYVFTQNNNDTIHSNKLDSLIWEEINKYRVQNEIKPSIVFEDSLMRAYTKRVTEENFNIYPTKHSDSIGYWCNSECLYSNKTTGGLNWEVRINRILNNDFDGYAKLAVQGWIASPSHNHQILRKDIEVSTIYSLILIDYKNQVIRFDTTFHGLSNEPNSTFDNNYNYYLKK
jgi:hypothetical protein